MKKNSVTQIGIFTVAFFVVYLLVVPPRPILISVIAGTLAILHSLLTYTFVGKLKLWEKLMYGVECLIGIYILGGLFF